MKSTNSFKQVIEQHLKGVADKDSNFASKMADPKKSIDDCITYILNQVKKSGCNGFADQEIYGMAIHYYDEENVKVGDKVNAKVIINQEVKLSEKEIENLKKQAKENVIEEEMKRLRKKPSKAKKENPNQSTVEPSLFD